MIINQIQEYINSHNEQQFAIHCETEEKAIELLKMLANLGFIWSVNTPLLNGENVDTRWYEKKAKTCYTFTPGSNILLTARKEFYANKGVDIISYDDFINQFSQINEKFVQNTNDIIDNTVIETAIKNTNVTSTEMSENIENYIYCANCGNKIKSTSKFCFSCGAKNSTTKKTSQKECENISDYQETDLNIADEITQQSNSADNNIPNIDSDNSNTKDTDEIIVGVESHKIAIKEQTTNKNIDDDLTIETKNTDNNWLQNYLGVKPNEKFQIIGPENDYLNKTFYRFNDKGFREKEVASNVWFLCNNEQELLYLINSGRSAIKIYK